MKRVLQVESYFPFQLKENTVIPIYNCFMTALGTVLRTYGYSPSELSFMLFRNMGFYWSLSVDKIVYGCDFFSVLEDINEMEHIKVVPRTFDNSYKAFEKIQEDIQQGIPQVVHVNQYYIPGLIPYKKDHKLHCLLLIGIDDKKILLEDIGVILEVNFEDFINSLSLSNNLLYSYDIPSKRTIYDKQSLLSIFKRNVEYGLSKESFYRNDHQCRCGVAGVRKFAEDLLDPLYIEKMKTSKILSKLGTQTYTIVVQRYSHLAFLNSSKGVFGNEISIEVLIKQVEYLVHDWKVIRNLFHKASVGNENELLPRISQRLKKVAAMEEELFLSMQLLL